MKKYLFVLGLLLLVFGIHGQNAELRALLNKSLKYRVLPDSGKFYANEALILSRELRFREGEQLSKMYAGLSYYNNHEVDTATTLLYDALPDLEGLPFEEGLAHWYIGKIHARTRNLESGEGHYLKALDAFTKTDSSAYLGSVYNSLGIIQGMQNNYTEALEWFTKAYILKSTTGKELSTAPELSNIAMVYARMGSYRKAIDYVREAIQLRDDDDDYSSYSTLGGTYNLMGKQDSAFIYYQKALEKALEYGHERHYANAIVNLANIHYQRGNHEKAISMQRNLLHEVQEDPRHLFSIYTSLGKSYRKIRKYDSALYFLRKGLKLSKAEGDKVWAKESTAFLGYQHADLGRYDSAFYYLSQNLAYVDSLNGDRMQEIFANQRVTLETFKKQHEIDLLKKEGKISRQRQQTFILGGASVVIIGLLAFLNFRARLLLKQRRLQADKDLLQKELDKNQAELSAFTLNMIHRKNSLDEIESHIEQLESKEKRKIKSILSVNKALEKDWENFTNYFSGVHATFFEQLRSRFPGLSQSEIRLSALIKMDLANNEIATLLNIESKSVRMARYRLKKKLNLDEDADLFHFIHQIE